MKTSSWWRPRMQARVTPNGILATVILVRNGMALCAWAEGPPGAEQPRFAWFRFDRMELDLDDAATVGALLAVLREVTNTPPTYLYPSTDLRPDGTSLAWFVYSRSDRVLGGGSTPGGAVLTALLLVESDQRGQNDRKN